MPVKKPADAGFLIFASKRLYKSINDGLFLLNQNRLVRGFVVSC